MAGLDDYAKSGDLRSANEKLRGQRPFTPPSQPVPETRMVNDPTMRAQVPRSPMNVSPGGYPAADSVVQNIKTVEPQPATVPTRAGITVTAEPGYNDIMARAAQNRAGQGFPGMGTPRPSPAPAGIEVAAASPEDWARATGRPVPTAGAAAVGPGAAPPPGATAAYNIPKPPPTAGATVVPGATTGPATVTGSGATTAPVSPVAAEPLVAGATPPGAATAPPPGAAPATASPAAPAAAAAETAAAPGRVASMLARSPTVRLLGQYGGPLAVGAEAGRNIYGISTTDTADYRKRVGMNPAGQGLGGDLAARAGGAVMDLGAYAQNNFNPLKVAADNIMGLPGLVNRGLQYFGVQPPVALQDLASAGDRGRAALDPRTYFADKPIARQAAADAAPPTSPTSGGGGGGGEKPKEAAPKKALTPDDKNVFGRGGPGGGNVTNDQLRELTKADIEKAGGRVNVIDSKNFVGRAGGADATATMFGDGSPGNGGPTDYERRQRQDKQDRVTTDLREQALRALDAGKKRKASEITQLMQANTAAAGQQATSDFQARQPFHNIDRSPSQEALAGAEAENSLANASLSRIKAANEQAMSALTDELLNPKTPPERRREISNIMAARSGRDPEAGMPKSWVLANDMGGQRIVERDPNTGMPVERPVMVQRYVDKNGQVATGR